jgi:hypothetical protein
MSIRYFYFLAGFITLVSGTAPDFVINLADSAVSMQNKIAVQVCAGLLNRDLSSPSVYTLLNQPYDSQWLVDIEGVENPILTDVDGFLNECLSRTKVFTSNTFVFLDYPSCCFRIELHCV